jgi:thiol-disulfide isomerase/thioredoxin
MTRWLLILTLACSRRETPHADPAKKSLEDRVEMILAPPFGDVARQITEVRAEQKLRGRMLVVYIGATWCEPCQRFHRAAKDGKLDDEFPMLTLFEYDLDQDGQRLSAAGYSPRFIPYFGVPGESGRASNQSFEGSIKGEGSVGDITPKLHALLGSQVP